MRLQAEEEKVGEQIKAELASLLKPLVVFLNKKRVVSGSFDLGTHSLNINLANLTDPQGQFVSIDLNKNRHLPPNIKCVLSHWGCIYVDDVQEHP